MGYSCSAKASEVHSKLINILQVDSMYNTPNANTWTHKGISHFDERGRENNDGAITGRVYKMFGQTHCKPIGSYRIEPDGTISRYPTSTKKQREKATKQGLEASKVYGTLIAG